jgi:hypothetical protein
MIIFTPTEFVSRPVSGPELRVAIRDIIGFEATSMSIDTVSGWRAKGPAVKIRLKDGSTHIIPLDFPNRGKILEQLRLTTDRDRKLGASEGPRLR